MQKCIPGCITNTSECIDIPNHTTHGSHPCLVSDESDSDVQDVNFEEDICKEEDESTEVSVHPSRTIAAESPFPRDYIDENLRNQMGMLHTEDVNTTFPTSSQPDEGDSHVPNNKSPFSPDLLKVFALKQGTYSPTHSTEEIPFTGRTASNNPPVMQCLQSILSTAGAAAGGKASNSSQSNTPENHRKQVLVQDHDGTKSKPSRPPTAKKTKQPNISKKIEQCRSSKCDNLDLSNQSITQLPSLKDLPNVRYLMLYENKLTELPKSVGDMSNLEQLIVHQNQLQASGIPEEMQRCTKLKMIDIRKNRFESLPPKPFFHLPSLEHLFVSYNRLVELRPEIGNAKTLTVLILSHNALKVTLPSTIGQLSSLHTLDVSHNFIEYLPDEIGQCVSLKDLKVQHNRLSCLPDTIGNLKNLVKLGLKYNHLTSLPASLAQCTQLDEFNIENNLIVTLPDSLLARLPKVQTITLSRNNFSTFPPGGPHQFSYVQTLNLDHNHLDSVPVGIFSSATHLQKLKLTDNEITNLVAMDIQQHWTQLVELDLGSNQLRSIPSTIGYLINLEKLNLSYNQLKNLPLELWSLSSLQVLDLEGNLLQSLPSEIGQLKKLNEINLISNQLGTVPSSIGELESLKKMRLGYNDIRYLPPEIGNMTNLVELYLNDNEHLDNLPVELSNCSNLHFLNLERCPLRDLPSQVVTGGSALIIYFLQQVAIFQNSRTNM